MYIYLYLYEYIIYIIYIHIYIYTYIYIVCDHEITEAMLTICLDKFLAFLHQQRFTKLY